MARRLLLLNGLATLGVVLNHASSWAFIGMFWWADRYRDVAVPNFDQLGSASYYVLRIVEQLVAFTVPSFLFVSGFFIAFVGDRGSLPAMWSSAWSRIRTLAVPYLIWSTILLIERLRTGEHATVAEYLRIYLMGRAADPYYFVPLLCQCLLLSPLLLEGAKRSWMSVLAVAALLHLMVQGYQYAALLTSMPASISALGPLTGGWLFPGKLVWFVLGIVVSLHLEAAQKGFYTYRWLFAVAAVLLLPLGVLEWELLRLHSSAQWITYRDTLMDSLYAVSIIAVVMAFTRSNRLPFADAIQDVGKQSYGVYLVHSIVLVYGARLVYHIAPWLLGLTVLYFLGLVLVGLGAPLIAMRTVRESRFKGSYKSIFG